MSKEKYNLKLALERIKRNAKRYEELSDILAEEARDRDAFEAIFQWAAAVEDLKRQLDNVDRRIDHHIACHRYGFDH